MRNLDMNKKAMLFVILLLLIGELAEGAVSIIEILNNS